MGCLEAKVAKKLKLVALTKNLLKIKSVRKMYNNKLLILPRRLHLFFVY